jgi:hypothetical protein
VSYEAIKRMLKNVKETGKAGLAPEIYTPLREELEEVIGLPEFYRIESETTEKM